MSSCDLLRENEQTGLGVTFQMGASGFVCWGEAGCWASTTNSCAPWKCRLSALPGWPLWPITGEANALADISIWMDEMFCSFADTGDHMPIIITMLVYTSLCKCLLTQWWLSNPPHISFVLGRMVSGENKGGINSGLLRYVCLCCKGYTQITKPFFQCCVIIFN